MILEAMNAVKWYFNRNWRRRDLMNSGTIPVPAHEILETVYLTLFGAMLCSTVGSYFHLFWEVGGLFTVLCSVASLLWLCFTSPQRVARRVSLLLMAAYYFGASVGLFTKYLFEMAQAKHSILALQPCCATFLAGTTIGVAIFYSKALITRERSDIYLGFLLYSCAQIVSCFQVNAIDIIDSHTAHAMFKVIVVQILFMGYLVVYSQEILYNAHLGDIDIVNCTLTVFFHLPGILVHAARVLCLPD
ncbi:bax inhibitor 1-like [Capsicum annuum]|uniref:bax inhibitor 1-like n=1 Tax=Capsicum annuum TaxID=4072 RepID=UPI0007BF6FFC|nr:bax inhibitor 1-like [Capsicum annuum]